MSIRKLNTKTNQRVYYKSLRTGKKKKLTKFVSKTQEGGDSGRIKAMNNVFVVRFLRVYFWVN